MSRAAVFTLVSEALPGIPVYEANSVDSPTAPFIILRWGAVWPEVARLERVGIYAHDTPGSYDWINQALDAVESALTGALHVPGGDGRTLTLAESEGRSVDLWDDGFMTITKSADFKILSRVT